MLTLTGEHFRFGAVLRLAGGCACQNTTYVALERATAIRFAGGDVCVTMRKKSPHASRRGG